VFHWHPRAPTFTTNVERQNPKGILSIKKETGPSTTEKNEAVGRRHTVRKRNDSIRSKVNGSTQRKKTQSERNGSIEKETIQSTEMHPKPNIPTKRKTDRSKTKHRDPKGSTALQKSSDVTMAVHWEIHRLKGTYQKKSKITDVPHSLDHSAAIGKPNSLV
jgi:hypothetical protein